LLIEHTDNLELSGFLYDCSLDTIKDLYKEIFKSTLDISTEHEIVFTELSFVLSSQEGITLCGAVSVDGHEAAEAPISISSSGIQITGSISEFSILDVKVEKPSLDLSISKTTGFSIQLSGRVSVEKHKFDVSVYLHKQSGHDLEYTVFGCYQGEFYLHYLCDAIKDSPLKDVYLKSVAVCFSNMDKPKLAIKENVMGYKIKRGMYEDTLHALLTEVGFQLCAMTGPIESVKNILRLEEAKPFVLRAYYETQKSGTSGSKLGIEIQIPKTDFVRPIM
jgi:hypothetical protein